MPWHVCVSGVGVGGQRATFGIGPCLRLGLFLCAAAYARLEHMESLVSNSIFLYKGWDYRRTILYLAHKAVPSGFHSYKASTIPT